MHIPNLMLQGNICPVTAAVSAAALTGFALAAARSKEKPAAARVGAVAALIFAAQMINFPVQSGTSGHLFGGVLASALLGVPFGVLVTALVLLVQSLVFSDGGLTVLGANVLNMAVLGAGAGGWLFKLLAGSSKRNSGFHSAALGVAAWISVMLAALACSLELGIAGTASFSSVVSEMLGVHAWIGIGEGVITAALYHVFSARTQSCGSKGSAAALLMASAAIAAVLSPFASSYPDGLEWIAQKYLFLHEAAPSFVSPLQDYSVPFITGSFLSTGLAGLTGVLMTFATGFFFAGLLARLKPR